MARTEDDLPTLRSSEPPPAPDDDTTLWLVSFADDDDRELKPPQIAEAIARGEIDAESIVWREGMADWLPIGGVPSLAKLLPKTGETRNAPSVMTGGFLGTGMKLGTKKVPVAPVRAKRTSEPPKIPPRAKARRSNPPPVPQRRSGRKSVPPHQRPARASEPPLLDEEPISLEPDALSMDSSRPGVDPSPTLPQAKALSAGTFALDATSDPSSSDDESPPSSGTPSLNALAAVSDRERPRYDDEIMKIGTEPSGGLGLLAPPTIDLSDLSAGEATTPPIARVDDDSEEPTKPLDKGRQAPARKPAEQAATGSAAKKSDDKKPAVLTWLIAGAVVIGAVWAFAKSSAPSPSPPTPVETQAANEPLPEPEPPAVTAEPDPPEPEMAEPEPAAAAEPREKPEPSGPKPPISSNTEPARAQKPAAANEATPPATAQSNQGAPAPSAATSAEPEKKAVELAGPFDKAAAATALQNAAGQASSCRQEGDPSGQAVVRVTFAESGRAVRAVVEGPPFAGTRTGGCIASVMRRATVPPFSGDRLTVSKTVVIQ